MALLHSHAATPVTMGIVLCVFLSQVAAQNGLDGSPVVVSGPQFEGVIFPASMGPAAQRMTGGVSGYWTPPQADVLKFESGLADFLATAIAAPEIVDRRALGDNQRRAYVSQELTKIVEHLAEYRRQYCGLVVGGRRAIFVNLFPEPPAGDSRWFAPWTEQWVQVEDGGFWYWRIFYAPEDAEYFGFEANGYA